LQWIFPSALGSVTTMTDRASRLLKNSHQCHPEVAPILRVRRICFAFSTRRQQILRFAQDDTLRKQFFSSLLVFTKLAQRPSRDSPAFGIGVLVGGECHGPDCFWRTERRRLP
jgi:hypothetical protein